MEDRIIIRKFLHYHQKAALCCLSVLSVTELCESYISGPDPEILMGGLFGVGLMRGYEALLD